MKHFALRLSLGTSLLLFLGAGCSPDLVSTSVAQPFEPQTVPTSVQRASGFGALPTLPPLSHSSNVTLASPPPTIPAKVTVIRPHHGTPNDTEFRNLLNALGISDAFIGKQSNISEISLAWQDDQSYRWSYQGSDSTLSFSSNKQPNEALTGTTLPDTGKLLAMAADFLQNRGLSVQAYGQPYLYPDWSAWWSKAQASGHCTDAQALATIRSNASSETGLQASPPILPASQSTLCVAPEFPADFVVHFPAVMDDNIIVNPSGNAIDGVTLTIDTIQQRVVAGSIHLPTDADRSDYPALSAAQVESSLLQGGITNLTGPMNVTAYDLGSIRVSDSQTNDVYLVPSLLANGIQLNTDGTTSTATIVVPLVSQ